MSDRSDSFDFELVTPRTPQEVIERVLDVRRHGDLVPLTQGSGPSPADVVPGSRLVARTALGWVGFDDVMEVVELAPGSRVVLRKVGSVIGGEIELTCRALPSGTRVRWQQRVVFPFLPDAVNAVAVRMSRPGLRWGYHQVVQRLLDA